MEEMKDINETAELNSEAGQTPSEHENGADQGTDQSGSEAEKLFTQAELERIIKKRLKRVEAKISDDQTSDYAQRVADLDRRESDLKARETRLQCKEYIMEKGYSADLTEILDISDFEAFKEKADRLAEIYHVSDSRNFTSYPALKDAGEVKNTGTSPDAAIRKAFLSKGKHKPKEF